MDMFQASKFFDRLDFDAYDPVLGTWQLNAFKGQLKSADKFVSIWNRPTRKRLLYTAPGQEPTKDIIRVPTTGEIFLVGSQHKDSHQNKYYRDVTGLHQAAGPAVVKRRAPTGPSNDPGWAVQTTVSNTYADSELRSVNESMNEELINFGHFFLFLPMSADVADLDTVTFGGVDYLVVNTYIDSGFRSCRATTMPDERTNMVFISVGATTYNVATQQNQPSEVSYNITAKATPVQSREDRSNGIAYREIDVIVQSTFIGVVPKVNDKITYAGKTYTISEVNQNAVLNQWTLRAYV